MIHRVGAGEQFLRQNKTKSLGGLEVDFQLGRRPAPERSLLAPFGLVFGGRLDDPRARHGDRGSGLARGRKQSQALIVGGVSLEAAPPARQDDAETASIIVNGRKGLYEHGHRGARAVAVSSAPLP